MYNYQRMEKHIAENKALLVAQSFYYKSQSRGYKRIKDYSESMV